MTGPVEGEHIPAHWTQRAKRLGFNLGYKAARMGTWGEGDWESAWIEFRGHLLDNKIRPPRCKYERAGFREGYNAAKAKGH